jgi:tetratricopeptide (TPR) repeat protein
MIPGETQWTIIFPRNYTSWGSFFYDESEDALRITVNPITAEFKEWLTYGLDNFTKNSADVFLHWEKLKVSFNVEVDVDKLVLASIKNQLRSTAGFTWMGYMQAAVYYYHQNTNLDLALEWIKKSVSLNENEQNWNILGYIHMAQGNLEEALSVLKENVKKYPQSWNVYDSLAECYQEQDKKKEAVKYYKMALKKAPANQNKRIEDNIKKLSSK